MPTSSSALCVWQNRLKGVASITEVIIAGLLSSNTAFILQGGLVTGLMAVLLYDAMAAVEKRFFSPVNVD